MAKKTQITLVSKMDCGKIAVKQNANVLLPKISIEGETFLGWNKYQKINFGYMNINTDENTTLYAISTNGPAYVIESYFRGVPNDYKGERAHFRRYIVDIYLENTKAKTGSLKIENCNNILYYLSNVPIEGISAKIEDETNRRGSAYRDVAYFTTAGITINWESAELIDATIQRKKIASLMFCFSRWGMSYNEIDRRTSDDIIIPAYDYKAIADNQEALVSANFYNGQKMEIISSVNDAICVKTENDLPKVEQGNLLSRFAVLSDSHIGVGYNWENYNWLYRVFDHLKKLHKESSLDFVVELGDSIDDGYAETFETDYNIYLEEVKKLEICDPENPIDDRAEGKIPHYEIQGNHDTSFDTRFFRTKLWYSENEQGQKVAFVAFFTKYGGYPAVNHEVEGSTRTYKSYGILTDDVVEFVQKSVEEARKNDAVHIVLLNHFGIAQDLGAPILPETGLGKIESICKKHGIKLYLSGHEHNVNYSLRKYNSIYNFDVAATFDKYAVYEIYEKCFKVMIYKTEDNKLDKIYFLENS